jgi:hypothetical protein
VRPPPTWSALSTCYRSRKHDAIGGEAVIVTRLSLGPRRASPQIGRTTRSPLKLRFLERSLSRGTSVTSQKSPVSDDTAACSRVPYLNIWLLAAAAAATIALTTARFSGHRPCVLVLPPSWLGVTSCHPSLTSVTRYFSRVCFANAQRIIIDRQRTLGSAMCSLGGGDWYWVHKSRGRFWKLPGGRTM